MNPFLIGPSLFARHCVAGANQETFLRVQIETPQAVRNIESIVALAGIDMIFVGPGELGSRLRQSGKRTLAQAWASVAATCKKHGILFGGPATTTEELHWRRH
ncbi:MAG: aldolase/citrate lyase family protein [Bryobacterales bacterium]|nr:aldolase/citrate lyase family protein [Bryobacterales bacterium]